MLFNFSVWENEGAAHSNYALSDSRNKLKSKIEENEETQDTQINRLLTCIERREKTANILFLVAVAMVVLIPCLIYFGHPQSMIYSLCFMNALLVGGIFYNKKDWENKDYKAEVEKEAERLSS